MNINLLIQRAHRHGAILQSDLVPNFISRSAWFRAHHSGLLVPIHPGVSRLATRELTPRLAIEAALAATLPESCAGGLTSALLWGADSARSDFVELLAPDGRHPGRLTNVVFHRPTDEKHPRRVPIDGLWACDPMRATLDVAAWHPDRLDTVMAELVIAGRYGLKTLQRTLDDHRRCGRPGILNLERAIVEWKLGDRPPDSLLEKTMSELLARYSLPPAEFQRKIGRYQPDFTFVDEIAVLECDGWGDHGRTREQHDDDREREAELSAMGWAVWRYTWMQITRRDPWVARTLRARLAARRAQLGLPPLPT